MCILAHNGDMSGTHKRDRFGRLHVDGLVYVRVWCVSVGTACLEQHLPDVFVSETVEDWVQQGAASRWNQGGIGVEGRTGCISQQPPEGERHPAAHEDAEHQDQPGEAPPTYMFACI